MAQQQMKNKMLFKTKVKRFFAKFVPSNWKWVKNLPVEAKAFLTIMFFAYGFCVGGAALIAYAFVQGLMVTYAVGPVAFFAAGVLTLLYGLYALLQSLRI